MYIPFALLFSLQAALGTFGFKQPAQEPESITPLPLEFMNPELGGGSFIDKTPDGLGEPLNVIISGLSSPWVLSDGGFVLYANAIGFDKDCFDVHFEPPQAADLGDGRGWMEQIVELRDDYGNYDLGTCWESLVGGNHLRMWRQDGSNALFLAVSEEDNVYRGHTIRPNGYNLGRESFVNSAVGMKSHEGVRYQTVAQNLTGYVKPGSDGINHGIAIDGVIALLTVTILQ